MLIDLEVAVTAQRQAEAAMPCDLLQHVIVKTDAGIDFRLQRRVKIDPNGDAGLVRIAFDDGDSIGITQALDDVRPVHRRSVGGVDQQPVYADLFCQLHVGLTIADHRGRSEIDVGRGEITCEQSCAWLAASTVVGGQVRADQDLIESDPLRCKQIHDVIVACIETGLWKCIGTQAVLVAYDDESVTVLLQLEQGGYHARYQPDFVERIDLTVMRLFDQRSVAIQEKCLNRHRYEPPRVSSVRNN